MSTGDLIAFLRSRLGDDEADASGFAGAPSLLERQRREVEAKRAILDEHEPSYPTTYPKPSGEPTCRTCQAGTWDWEPPAWPCRTTRILAAVYSDHPDYQDEWKP